MSALKSKKQLLLLPLVAALLIGAFALLQPSNKESATNTSTASALESVSPVAVTLPSSIGEPAVEAHPEDCKHCNSVSVAEAEVASAPVLSTQPQFDQVFKGIVGDGAILSRSDFEFLKGSQVGQSASFTLGGQTFDGKISLVREGERSSTYAVTLEGGTLSVSIDRNDEFQAFLLLNGDSRVVKIAAHKEEGLDGDLLASEISVSDVFCAPTGAVYPLNGPQPVDMGALAARQAKEYPALTVAAAPVILDSIPGAEHVLYCDFDGEVVTGDLWNTYSGVTEIDADAHPRANEDAFVTAVWQRVVEDFAPFNITVTTDRAVYDAADPEQRLHAIITPTDDAQPGSGGVAWLGSYQNSLSRIVWIYRLDEYFCASTISHEAGHAFGLNHDGPGAAPFVDYYGGHNSGYTPGWAPIMGAFENDQPGEVLLDEVDQWSRGEYTDANNQEDDVAIIGGGGNGFGFKADDYADTFDASGSLDVGLLAVTGENQVGASGLISRAVDVDVFRFTALYTGDITLTVSPLDVQSADSQLGSSTQGANLAVQVRVLDAAGALIATGTESGAVNLGSTVEAHVDAGINYLVVEGAGRGTDGTDGFTDYASLGEYTVVGDLPTPPLSIFGGDKTEDAVLLGDTDTQVLNGTEFGFSYPSAAAIAHTFRLTNTESTALTNISVSLASGVDFIVVSPPVVTIPANSSVFMTIAYDPIASGQNGVDSDTVIVNYDAAVTETFEFAVSGTSTLSATKDNYESNDGWTSATNLNSYENVWLSDYKGLAFFTSDVRDQYAFTANVGELVTIEVGYDASEGPVTFVLKNQYVDLGATSSEDGIIQYRVPLTASLKQRTFRVSVTNTADSSVYNAYDLRWSSIPLVAGEDDYYEENDTQDQAFDLTGAFSTRLSEYLGEGISNDEDWYKIEIPRDPFTRMLYIAAEFEHAEGNIDIEVVDENGLSFFFSFGSTVSATENDYEVITVHEGVSTADFAENFSPEGNVAIMGVEPGTYYIRVYGDFAGNSYDLIVEPRRDDSYEVVDLEGTENDEMENAFDLGDTIVDRWLSEVDGIGTCSSYAENATQENFINGGDVDWYEFSISPDAPVEQLLLEYSSFDGGFMVFELFDSAGDLLGSNVEVDGSTTTIFSLGAISIPAPSDATYYVRVVSDSDISGLSGYDFRVTFSTEPPFIEGAVEDNYEENDSFQELFDLRDNAGFWLSAIDGYGTQLDPDWFEIVVPQGATQLYVECVLNSSEGNMDIRLSRKEGAILFTSTDGGDTESITWDNPTPGAYTISVIGDRRGNNYNLFWDVVREDDNYEENDVLEEADLKADLSATERTWLRKVDGTGIQKDEDWYKITVPVDTAELQIFADFDDAAGDIDLELYNAGGYLIARSVSTTDDESITMTLPESGEYYIQLHYGNEGNEYDLWWAAFNAIELAAINNGQDAYEENDSQGAAYVLSADQVWLSDLEGLGTQSDDDWFQISIDDNSLGLDVDVTFTHADGDIDVEIYDPLGSVLVRSDSVTDDEIINFNAPLAAGTYWIRVYGSNVGNEYDMYWLDRTEDIYEQNDTRATAYDLSANQGVQLATISVPTQGDDDWYQILVTGDDPYLFVQLDYVHANGSIDFGLYDASGSLLQEATSTDDSEYIFRSVPAGDYFIKVFGDDLHNDYDLLWEVFQDDAYEQNDSFGTAADISGEEAVALDGAQFDDDWFKVSVTDPNSYLAVLLTFDHAEGNIDLVLYDTDGVTPLATSASAEDFESVSVAVPVGDYYFKVTGDNLNPTYDILWSVTEDDVYEENDTRLTADDSSSSGDTLEGVQLDEDWFEIIIQPGEVRLDVDLVFTHADGDINLSLYDAADNLLASSATDTDNESLLYGPDPVGGPLYIKVDGVNVGNTYSLTWSSTSQDVYEGDDGNNTYDDPSLELLNLESQYLSDALGFATSEDEDWYEIELASGDQGLVIEAYFTHADGNIDIELFDSNEIRRDGSTGVVDGERILYFGSQGTYYIRVFGDLAGNTYDLFWNSFKEDDHEDQINSTVENDTDATPRSINDEELALIEELTQLDSDWYTFDVEAGDDILIVDCDFLFASGNIDLKLYIVTSTDPLTKDVVAFEGEATDGERIEVANPVPGTYLLHVYFSDLANTYSLRWNSTREDPYEENDLLGNAYDLGQLDQQDALDRVVIELNADAQPLDFGTQFDEDWFQVEVSTPGQSHYLSVLVGFENVQGNLDLRVYDSGGDLIEESVTSNDTEVIEHFGSGVETYYIQVVGEDLGTNYSMSVSNALDDSYEENDERADAFVMNDALLSDIAGPGFQKDADFYQVSVPINQIHLKVDCTFIHDLGNLNLTIFDLNGVSIGTVDTSNDDETLEVSIPPIAAFYYILVDGASLGTSYDLSWSYDNIDNYEENDISDDAFDLTPPLPAPTYMVLAFGEADGHATQTDEDWYSLDVSQTSAPWRLRLLVDLEFEHADGNIDVAVYSEDNLGTPIQVGVSSDDNESLVIFIDLLDGTKKYYIKVTGDNSGNSYDLAWDFSSSEDFYEVNNFVHEAYDLTNGENQSLFDLEAYGAQSTDDWYAIAVSDGSTALTVNCSFSNGNGDIDLEVYRLDDVIDGDSSVRKPTLVTRVESSDDDESLTLPIGSNEHGIYFIRVFHGNTGSPYDLIWFDSELGADDSVIIGDYLTGDWDFVLPSELASALLASPNANADGDALPNWAEYALALDASIADTAIIGQSIVEIEGEDYFQFEFLRTKEAVAYGYEFIVEESGNMVFDGSTAVFVGTEDVDSDIERVLYRGSAPIDEVSNCFFRLKVVEPVAKD